MKFSILMSLYFKEKPEYLDISLRSVFTQSLKPDQVVLVLDGPITKELSDVVEKYKFYSSLEVYPQTKNNGLSTALNIGLEYCRNEIVFRMDTDDICYSNRFEKMLSLFKSNPELELAGSFATMINQKGEELHLMTTPCTEKEIRRLVWTCPFIHPTVVFKKSAIQKVGGYNPNSGPRQDDYELWFRCIQHGLRCQNLSETLLYYRFFYDSLTKNNIKVGWWRFKVGLRGAWKCKCSPIAFIGVAYPLFRSLLPLKIREKLYNLSFNINKRSC